MAVSKVYKTRLVSVAADNEKGVEIRKILEDAAFVGMACTFVHDKNNLADANAVKVYMEDGAHIGYLMKGAAKSLAPLIDAGKIVHGYIKELSYYDQSKESITAWGGGGKEQLTNCYINVWACDAGDDESACYDLLKKPSAPAAVKRKPEPQAAAFAPLPEQQRKPQKRGLLASLFGK